MGSGHDDSKLASHGDLPVQGQSLTSLANFNCGLQYAMGLAHGDMACNRRALKPMFVYTVSAGATNTASSSA